MSDSANILLVEDNRDDAELLHEALIDTGYPFALEQVDCLADAQASLARRDFDVVLLDLTLPDSHGLDTLHLLLENSPDATVVVLTCFDDDTMALNAIEAGAQDYLTKGRTDTSDLVRAIRHAKARKHSMRVHRDLRAATKTAHDANRAIAQCAQDAIVTADSAGNILFWNTAAEKIFDLGAHEAIGKNMLGLIVPPRYHGAKRKAFAEFAQTGGGAAIGNTLELTALRKDGTEFPIEISLSSYEAEQGFVAVALIRDITERKRTEEALQEAHAQLEQKVKERTTQLSAANKQLREEIKERRRAEHEIGRSEERYRATFDQAAVAIAHVGLDGRWLKVNERLCHVVGYSRNELLQLTFQDITHPDDLEADVDYVRRVLAGEIDTYSMEKRYIHKEGGHVWIALTVSLVRDARGKPEYFISVIDDITARKHTELELEKAKESADKANRAKSDFVASMSHELRTPLNGVIGMIELLLSSDLDPQQRKYAWLAKSSGNVLLALINDVLDFSKIEAGKLELETTDLDLRHTVDSLGVSLASRAESRGLAGR